MELVAHTINVPKETKEAIDLIKQVAIKITEGGKLVDYTQLVDELFTAIKGADEIPSEIKSENKEDIIAYLVKEVGGVFI